MGEVVDLAQHKAQNSPHMAGPARCLACKATWTAVAPVGRCDQLECPECGTQQGVFDYPPNVEGDPVFVCACGCEHLALYRNTGLCCYRCGVRVDDGSG